MQNLESQSFPSLDLIYQISVASYETVTRRIDNLDGRIQTVTAFLLTSFFALPIFGRFQELSFNHWGFVFAMLFLTVGLVLSVVSRLCGTVAVLNPATLKKDAHLPTETFQSYLLHYAVEAFDQNSKLLATKWKMSIWTIVAFSLSLASFSCWLMLAAKIGAGQ